MVKVQPCRNGCGMQIVVKEDIDGKWKPYLAETGVLHDCPNSEFNKQKQQGDQYRTPKPNVLSDVENGLIGRVEKLERQVAAIISGRVADEE